MTVYTPDEVAALLRVPRSRVLELIRGGAIEVVVLGPRTKRIRAEALDRYLDGRIVASREEATNAGQWRGLDLRNQGPKTPVARDRHSIQTTDIYTKPTGDLSVTAVRGLEEALG